MVLCVRPVRAIYRFLRISNALSSCRNVTGTAFKEEINAELLNSYNQDIRAGGVVPVFRRALLFPQRVAVHDEVGIYTYAGLHQAATALSAEVAAQLLGETERAVAYMCSNDASHVIAQWAIWMSGNIAVPLTSLHPPDMLKYFIADSDAQLVLCSPDFEKTLRPIAEETARPLLVTGREKEITAQLYQPNSAFVEPKEELLVDEARPNRWYSGQEALIIYTSGTTSKPKVNLSSQPFVREFNSHSAFFISVGVVWTHAMLATQIASLHCSWEYSASDVVLHTLPLHHIHGQLNSLNASLAAGARIRMLQSFSPHSVWARLLGMGEREEAKVTVFHGVPAMYARLASAHEQMFAAARTRSHVRQTLQRMRLMCAGSAPLPRALAERWHEISGHRLLERYGMSEAGMCLSNPYRPVEGRTLGRVGRPLPGIAARVAAVNGEEITPLVTVETPACDDQICLSRLGISREHAVESSDMEWKKSKVTVHRDSPEGHQGELLLKGPGVFTRYWGRAPVLGSKDFTADGWFRTGDTALYADDRFQILGRTSVDIIKTSGYKVSALQVESALLDHPNVADAAVVGVEDETQGEVITAVVVLKPRTTLTLQELKAAAGKSLAPYQLPKRLLVVEEMPRNAMGKLDKKVIKERYGQQLGGKA